MPREVTSNMARLGFRCDRGRPHVGRSIMLIELEKLLTYKDADGLVRADYATAIVEDNCLGKRSRQARIETFKRLMIRPTAVSTAVNRTRPTFRVLEPQRKR